MFTNQEKVRKHSGYLITKTSERFKGLFNVLSACHWEHACFRRYQTMKRFYITAKSGISFRVLEEFLNLIVENLHPGEQLSQN